jgi:hypothetical protein
VFTVHDQIRKEATVMLLKTMTSLAFAAACLTAAAAIPGVSAQAATTQGQSGDVYISPRHNIAQSERYARLVATDPSFRRERMRTECGPITDPVLHQRCIESFRQDVQAWRDGQTQAFYGSSMPSGNYSTSAGQ